MVRAAGQLLRVTVAPDPRLFHVADLAVEIQSADSAQRRIRLVFEFLRGADEDGQAVRLLVAPEPAPTGDRRFDALLAAIAEDRACTLRSLRPAGFMVMAGFSTASGGSATFHQHAPARWCIRQRRTGGAA